MRFFIRSCLFLMLLLGIAVANAASAWQIVPNESTLSFTATQNNSPVTGKFKQFNGEINFDPAKLDSSNVIIKVDLNSVDTSYKEVADTLKTAEWFDIQKFPEAVFKATDFTKTGNDIYQAKGTLTIRDKTQPVTLSFKIENYSATQFKLQGSTSLKRTAFGIGQGDWAKTNEIKDNVSVNFTISAVKN